MRPTIFLALMSLAAAAAGGERNELDAFMEKVLERRDVNWADLDRYVFRETERMDIRLGDRVVEREDAEYVRFVRDGVLIRSPVKVDGVAVSDAARERYEAEWRAEHLSETADAEADTEGESRRASRRYFLGLDYEPGNYYLAGRETFEGREVLRIEYYPVQMFDDEDEGGSGDADEDDELEEEIERKLAKTTKVTMLVLPVEHQIVRIAFNNPGMGFLPLAWLFRFDGIEASMTMEQPIPNVWLPREIVGHGEARTARGRAVFAFERRFFDYAEAGVETEMLFELPPDIEPAAEPGS